MIVSVRLGQIRLVRFGKVFFFTANCPTAKNPRTVLKWPEASLLGTRVVPNCLLHQLRTEFSQDFIFQRKSTLTKQATERSFRPVWISYKGKEG